MSKGMKSELSYSTLNTLEDTVSDSGSDNGSDIENCKGNGIAASLHWSVPFQNPTQAGFSPFVAFCFTINYILGTGFLTIPWAFVQSGLVLSSILMVLAAIASDVAKDFMIETIARAEAMLDDQMHWIERHSSGRPPVPPTTKVERERQSLLCEESEQEMTPYQTNRKRSSYDSLGDSPRDDAHHVHFPPQPADAVWKNDELEEEPKYLIEQRKFELSALCRVFLGRHGVQIYTFVICVYLCGALWAYTSVFSSAMATALPIVAGEDNESLNYLCYAIIFGCVVVPLSCLELDEQVPIQVFLTLCRFVMFFLMIGTSFLCADDELSESGMDNFEQADNFRLAGIAKTLPILVFANIFHHSIPGLAHPVGDKKKVGKIFTSTNCFTVGAYLCLGLTLGTAFGKGIEQSSNLNWRTFHAGTGYVDASGKVVGAAWWTRMVSFYIMLFPAIDVMSAFPLSAITLGNNIFDAVYGKRIHEVEQNRCLRTCFRLLASVPPIIFGILVRELGTITDYTGITGFLIGLCFPAILYIASRTLAQEKHFDLDTFYTSYGSSIPVAKFILWFGIFMMVFVFVTLTFFS
mmetsp:Transcript_12567/g.20248  ORF Transcript_12567/g.20248 Transcript_12567/m.20248 type:complete len:578 (+) Transcript_12567:272-2005(+)